MKTKLIFIGLKLTELIGLILILLGTYHLGKLLKSEYEWYEQFFYGLGWFFLGSAGIGFLILIGYGLAELIKMNWKWAKKISENEKNG